eukprot:CAMPEP_0183705562 /NCGR_PEP_ID=MMETSP0737-20130205/2615_1 /TAXON_ID=385413 /ORGANISM="Thalassiosira miniscula, Strain CCMP1093" /LENGTH=33 /DNA_ID= /DNA_START= /DNA_END= /DNA_ORIENTATION=
MTTVVVVGDDCKAGRKKKIEADASADETRVSDP